MIQVVMYKNDIGIHAFEISGHANSGPYGYDLVCAGVSAVSIGAVHALVEIGGFEPDVSQHSDGGYLHVSIPEPYKRNKEIQTILKTMIISLQSIEREYKKFIQITWE